MCLLRLTVRLFVVALAATFAAVTLLAIGLAALDPAGILDGLGSIGTLMVPGAAPSAQATERIPDQMLALYERAAPSCPGLSWTVLAAIGTVESSNGTSRLPGVHSGANYAGAEGPMQFEPATFAEYDEPVPPGGARPPSPYDAVDAVYAAVRLLCDNGAAAGADITAAVFAYNHSESYVSEVLSLARSFASQDPSGG